MAQSQTTEFWETLFASALPKNHLYAAAAVAAALVLVLMLAPSKDVSAYRDANLLQIRIPNVSSLQQELNRQLTDRESVDEVSAAPQDLSWRIEKIRRGDNLSTIFKRAGFSAADVYAVANTSSEAEQFKRLRAGESIAMAVDADGLLSEVVYERSPLESYRYVRTDTGFEGEKVARQTEMAPAFRHVTINHSLFLDGDKAGLSHNLLMQVANIFGWDIDFALDIRKGDSFTVLFEEEYLDGEKVGEGQVLAAEFTNRGQTFQAVRYEDRNGIASYYTPDGQPMRKAFLRAPLDFARVSSNFNPNRLHPILKTKRPHRGVDYAASTGTPVYAAGDGKVIASGYTKANGNYVVVQHGQKYTTKYLHLNSRKVKSGQHVRQRQLIGTVGATGYATGPHLHYEFLVDGVHRNPRTVPLPQAEPIAQAERARFNRQTGGLMTQLASHRTTQLALLEQ